MGAIERNGYTFEPEYSVTRQNGAIHVYRRGQFVEEIRFGFEGEFPEHDLIEELVNHYCYENKI
ncbi:YbxH family protein [Bacillus sp. WMMC1349]|uniref:YbxH family protein n=1 Tax=Bacillus sp. WMMC1349 TaxID=2736254 RepID=UPI0015540847|nr:YbxH family protein [Bacillus sp. WMMC1349]NPC91351.1 YbxH family protein [Bacillus sp. WMMC1349]